MFEGGQIRGKGWGRGPARDRQPDDIAEWLVKSLLASSKARLKRQEETYIFLRISLTKLSWENPFWWRFVLCMCPFFLSKKVCSLTVNELDMQIHPNLPVWGKACECMLHLKYGLTTLNLVVFPHKKMFRMAFNISVDDSQEIIDSKVFVKHKELSMCLFSTFKWTAFPVIKLLIAWFCVVFTFQCK